MVRANALTSAAPRVNAEDALLRLSDRTGDSERLRKVLDSLLALCRNGLEPPLRDALTECERQLVRLAERATINEQNAYFDSVRELKQRRGELAPRFFAWLENALARLGQGAQLAVAAESTRSKYTLSLSDEVLDEPTVLADIATKIEARIREPLYALGQRLAVLAGTPRIPAEQLPLGPRCCTDALRHAAAELTMPLAHRMVLYRCFERVLMLPIGAFYGALNNHLIELRVLPALHSLAAAPETGARPPQRLEPARDSAAAAKPAAPLRAVPPTPAPAQSGTAAEFARLRELLSACRHAERYTVSSATLQDVLAGLQSRRAAGAGGEDAAVLSGDRVRSEIFAALAERANSGHIAHLDDGDSDTIDLCAMLFESLARHARADGLAAWLLAKVQMPVLRLALRDKGFFALGGHPARQMLSELFDLAQLWVDEIETERDAALADDLKRIALKLAYEYREDPILFLQALDELGAHAQRLAQRAALAEKRQIEAAIGHDKLECARLGANAAIAARLAERKPSDFVALLLQRGWSDVLVVTLLREGAQSAAYARRLRVLDALSGNAAANDDADFDVREEVAEGLTLIGLHETDVQAVVRTLFGAAVHEDEPISQTELAIKLKSKPRLGGEDGAQSEPAPLSVEQQRALAQLQALAHGSWLEFVVSADGDVVRRKLAWYSVSTGRCLLLNPRGMPSESMSLGELARRLAAGSVRLLSTNDGSFVDRAWSAIVQMLKAFSIGPQRSSAAPAPEPQFSSAETEATPARSPARTLLLVDDEINVQRALIRVLRHDGYRILTASNANEALELLRENVVQVIVSDQRMPGMSGTEFLSKVKVTHPHTIRLLLSGFSDAAAITEAINRGAIYKFLTKPWDDADFRQQVSEAFGACAPR